MARPAKWTKLIKELPVGGDWVTIKRRELPTEWWRHVLYSAARRSGCRIATRSREFVILIKRRA